MRRFIAFGIVLGMFFAALSPAQAQYTTRKKTSSVAAQPKQKTTGSGFTGRAASSGYGTSHQAAASSSSPAQENTTQTQDSNIHYTNMEAVNVSSLNNDNYIKSQVSKASSRIEKNESGEEYRVTDPDFSVYQQKDAANMSSEEKVALLEAYTQKQENEARAREAEEQARKEAIAKKLATEKPRKGYVFDENANEVPVPKGEIWIYTTGYEQGELLGRVHCSWKVVLQNRGDTQITKLKVAFVWPNYESEVNYSDVPSNQSKTTDMFMYSPNCPSLRTKPRIVTKECEIGPMKADDCSKYVIAK